MSDSAPTERNRLGEEASAYLRAHADNPVNWQPYDERARAAARERDVPLFLSVGYSACHWCHVMAEESFEDPAIAAKLNGDFVPVKVDREERPDLDRVYQTVCGLVTGQGGWPLSVFCTPDGRPFYVGTYFPPEPAPNRPGFRQLLADVATSWEDEREEVEARADEWMAAARGELEDVPDSPGEIDGGALADVAEAAQRSADPEYGGFGRRQKFPQPRRIDALLRAGERENRSAYTGTATDALDAMAGGGLRDHVGGGFHRYCTDRDWTVPHFEKMCYDNAELPRVYLQGYRASGAERYADVARETFGFLESELRHPDGGFFATLDARSEGESGEQEEGAFYVWTPAEVGEAMEAGADGTDDPDAGALADLFCARYGVTEAGNFEGRNVLGVAASVPELAEEFDLAEGEVAKRLAEGKERVYDARAERPRPARDEKAIAAWNGLAISALAAGGLTLGERYTDLAVSALEFVRERLWDGEELARRYAEGTTGASAPDEYDGNVKGEGYLEDYAFLARGALDCYGLTGDVSHLAFGADLGRALVERFYDDGTLYFAPEGGDLPARPQELGDRSTPSPAGVAADVLIDLDAFLPEREFESVARSVLETHAETIDSEPLEHVSLALAADKLERGPLELTVSGGLPAAWRERLGAEYVPDLLLAPRPAERAELERWLDVLGVESTPAIWADRESEGGPTAYVCRRACSPPLSEWAGIEEWLAEFR
jgi:uncharacterized protein YyaL (SSP411 family)